MNTEHDVIIVGAGISGIGMACHLRRLRPGTTVTILEGRDAIGGTWDLFRYPGVRSDSDLYTYGYEFKPWTSTSVIAEAGEILDYLQEAVDEHGIGAAIRFGHQVTGASWSTEEGRWTVRFRDADGDEGELTARWLYAGTGYFDYDGGYRPSFPGEDAFAGQIVHPQDWPEDLDVEGRRVVVIGSGATAVTLVPALADRAAHVTMLQRSPGYVVSVPRRNRLYRALQRILPDGAAYRLMRAVALGGSRGMYRGCRKHPRAARRLIAAMTRLQLPARIRLEPDFTPRYDPWDERLCAAPSGDVFRAIRSGQASVVTGRIERMTQEGIVLESGRTLAADLVVTATGLNLRPLGGIALEVDGNEVAPSQTVAFKSMMLSGVPNFVFAFGYTNNSWTLKVDLVCEHACRLMDHMDACGYDAVVLELGDPSIERLPFFGEFAAGYVRRGQPAFWRQGSHGPWTAAMDYDADRRRLRDGAVQDPALRFLVAERQLALAA